MFCHDDPLAPFGSQESGGQGVYVYSLLKELDKRGWSIDAFARWDNAHKKIVSSVGKRSRVIRLKGGIPKYLPRKILLDLLPEIYDSFLRFIEHENPYELFHGHYWDGGWLALKASRQFGAPFIENFHSLGKIRLQTKELYSINKNGKDDFQKRFQIEKDIIRNANIIISLTQSEKEYMGSFYSAPPQKVIVVPGGVNLNIFKQIEKRKAREKLNINEKDFVLLFVGRLEWRKGVGTLIHATKLLTETIPNIKTIIIGGKIYGRQKNIDDFKEYQRLLKQAEESGIKDDVKFTGMITHERLPLFYSAANVFIVPSYYEPFGLVTLEGMACKIPVVSSRVGGLQIIIEDGKTGLLFEPRNPSDLKDKIMQIFHSPKLADDLVVNAYEHIQKNYSWKSVALKIENVYTNLISDKI